jgi:hypothetical protein
MTGPFALVSMGARIAWQWMLVLAQPQPVPGTGESGEGINAAGWGIILWIGVLVVVAVGLLVVMAVGARGSSRNKTGA